MKKYKIRYNTQSTGDHDKWRIIQDGHEILVSDISIDGHMQTSKDYIENLSTWKWHITCIGKLSVVDGVAHIKAEKSLIATHLAKTVSWRILGTIDTIILSWIVTGNLTLGITIGGLEVITKMILYFIHERAWHKFR